MSEQLKSYKMVDEDYCDNALFVVPSDVYLKSEADEVIRHQKYKRCLATAKLCKEKWLVHNFAEVPTKLRFYNKWENRWLELAKKFKEA